MTRRRRCGVVLCVCDLVVCLPMCVWRVVGCRALQCMHATSLQPPRHLTHTHTWADHGRPQRLWRQARQHLLAALHGGDVRRQAAAPLRADLHQQHEPQDRCVFCVCVAVVAAGMGTAALACSWLVSDGVVCRLSATTVTHAYTTHQSPRSRRASPATTGRASPLNPTSPSLT